MCIVIKKPLECSADEIDNFYKLVLKGEQVEISGLKDRIKKSKYLAFHYADNKLAGIVALKQPGQKYKEEDVFKKAGILKESEKYNLELGYAVTLEEYRGKKICSGLVKRLLETSKDQNIFATTYNQAMQIILKKNGFQKIGNPYHSKVSDSNFLQLFVKEKENLYG